MIKKRLFIHQQKNYMPIYNTSTRSFVVVMGIIIAINGIGHGTFEILQGNKPTVDIMERIGAFTIIPNYLLTGTISIIVSLLLLYWTLRFINIKHGPTIFLFLSVFLFFVGGGVAMTLGFIITWTVATRIDKPLKWWRKVIPEKTLNKLAKTWKFFFTLSFLFIGIGFAIWILLTPPGNKHMINSTVYCCWSFLGLGFIFLILTIVSGFARDIINQVNAFKTNN